LASSDLSKISDPYTRMSLQLQAAFGLRRGESIKIRPEWADRGDRLVLMDTWTKGEAAGARKEAWQHCYRCARTYSGRS